MKRACGLLFGVLLLAGCLGPQASIAPSDSRLRYVGRFDWRDQAGPRCAWAGSSVTWTVTASGIDVQLRDDGPNDAFQVVIDGRPTSVLAVRSGVNRYAIDTLPAGQHTVELFKRTEPQYGTAQFLGFDVHGSLDAPPPPSDRHIEIIGDSISVGAGNEGTDGDPWSAATENNWLSYGAVAARAVGADYSCIAWSGRRLTGAQGLPAIYDLALPTDPTSVWNFPAPAPQAVVINLGTNDFLNSPSPPDEATFVAACTSFIRHVLEHSPKAHIYCAQGPMVTGNPLHSYLQQVVTGMNDRQVSLLEFAPADPADGLGVGRHPSVATHRKMADTLVAALHRDLGW